MRISFRLRKSRKSSKRWTRFRRAYILCHQLALRYFVKSARTRFVSAWIPHAHPRPTLSFRLCIINHFNHTRDRLSSFLNNLKAYVRALYLDLCYMPLTRAPLQSRRDIKVRALLHSRWLSSRSRLRDQSSLPPPKEGGRGFVFPGTHPSFSDRS